MLLYLCSNTVQHEVSDWLPTSPGQDIYVALQNVASYTPLYVALQYVAA